MAGVIPNEGELELLSRALLSANLILRLFKNDYIPVDGSEVADFTESTETGYAAITLSTGSWVIADDAGDALGSYPLQTFSITEGASVYGYYITDTGNTKCIGAERFTGAPFVIPPGGGDIEITAKIRMS